MNSERFGALLVSAEMLIKVERGGRRSIRKVEEEDEDDESHH